MKKAIFFSIIASLLLFSCKKDHKNTPAPEPTKYKVNFIVTGFSQQILGSAGGAPQINSLKTASTANVKAAINVLYYYAYNSLGNQVSAIYQDSTYSNFGSITDNLAPGTYTIVFAGGKAGMNISNAYTIKTTNITGYGSDGYGYPWKDTFFDEFTITVSGGNVNQNITLNRIVSELSIDILDQIPANASKIVLSVSQDYIYYSLYNPTPYQSVAPRSTTFTLPAAVLGTTNYKQSIIMLNTIKPFNATIVCYDAQGHPLGQATVNNITLQPNTETILSGNLFGSQTGFTTSLNHAWDPTTINYPF